MQPNGSWYPVAWNAYLHTGGVLNRRSGGEGTSLRCALYFSYFRTSFSFSLWLGEWDHFTRRTETFRKISNMYGYFLYILHCMDFSVNFRWWGEGGMVTAAGPSCGPSAQGVKPPSVLRPGCCCYMQEIAPVDYWHQAHSSSLGGPRHFATGPGLTTVILQFKRAVFHFSILKRNFTAITAVFSVTWSFRNHSDMQISCSSNSVFYYNHNLKWLCCLIFVLKHIIDFFRILG